MRRTRVRRWLIAIAAPFILVAAPANGAEVPNLPVQSVKVEIRIGADRAAVVQEHYRFTRPVAVSFRYLTGPCSDVGPGPVSVKGPSGPAELGVSRTGPWVLLGPPRAHEAAQEYSVSYAVPLRTRTTNIPVVLPSQAFEPPPGAAMSVVDISVAFPGDDEGAAVVLPQMQPDGRTGKWSTKMLALPSFVRVRVGSESLPEECPAAVSGSESAPAAAPITSSGSLEWWFLGFVASLVAWVAFYMRWANARRGPSTGAHSS
jgi:hypothetical protein